MIARSTPSTPAAPAVAPLDFHDEFSLIVLPVSHAIEFSPVAEVIDLDSGEWVRLDPATMAHIAMERR